MPSYEEIEAAILQSHEYDDDDYTEDDWCGDCGKCEDCMDSKFDECGKLGDGGCSMAGSEYCDWECPFSNDDEEE
jgi:hypothetical protein